MSAAIETALFANELVLWEIIIGKLDSNSSSLNVGPRAENKFIMPKGETHFPMTPEARLKNDNLTGLLEFENIN